MLPTRLGSPQGSGMPPMNGHRGRAGSRGCLPGEYPLRQVDVLPAHAGQGTVLRQGDRVADDRFSGVDLYPGDEPTQEFPGPWGAAGGRPERSVPGLP